MGVHALSELYRELESIAQRLTGMKRAVAQAIIDAGNAPAPTRSEVSGLPCSADVVWDQDDECGLCGEAWRSPSCCYWGLDNAGQEDDDVAPSGAPEANPVDSSTFIPEETVEHIDRCSE